MIAALVLVVSLQEAQPPLLARPPAVVTRRLDVLGQWIRAAEGHVPGEVDAAALIAARLSHDDLQRLWVDIRALLALIENPEASTFVIRPDQPTGRFVNIYPARDDRETLLARASEIASGIGADRFYKRAAVLHADVAMLVRDGPMQWPAEPASGAPSRAFVRAGDGQQMGLHDGEVHWEFGRMLLGAVRQPSSDDTVRAWYRATMSYKLRRAELDTPHFDQGRQLFPNDAEILFLCGALHEALSNPRVQAARETIVLPTGITLEVGTAREELEHAHRHYSRALQIDPGHREARVRRGRVLARLGRHQDAVADLRRALDTSGDDLMTYYAQMFAGASEEALGRYAAARAAYQQAAALYARAQAPVLALSQLLHRTGDRQAAHAGLRAVLQPAHSKSEADDPWWDYHAGPGRFTAERAAALYRSLKADTLKP